MPRVDPKASAIVVGILVVIIVAIKLALAWIQFNRFWFWTDVVLIALSILGIIVTVIALFVDEWNRDEWLIFGGITILIMLFSIFTVNGAYDRGYSDEAIKTKAELEKMLEDYTFILSIYTGEFRLRVQGMVIDDFNKALCEAAPDKSCEQVIKIYDEYQELVGWKESADTVAKIWK